MTNSLVERLRGPVQWGYMCLADGGFIADNTPLEAADRLAALQPQSPSLMGSEGVELPHHVKQFLMSLDDGETHTFDDEDWGRPAQDAENLGLGYVIVWKQGWEFRLNDTGQKAMAALQSQPSVIRTEGEENWQDSPVLDQLGDYLESQPVEPSTVRDDALEEPAREECSCAEIDGEDPNCLIHELTIEKIAAWEDWQCATQDLEGYTVRSVARKHLAREAPSSSEQVAAVTRDDALEEAVLEDDPLLQQVRFLKGLTLNDIERGGGSVSVVVRAGLLIKIIDRALRTSPPSDPVARQMAEALRNMIALAEPHFTSAAETLALNESVNALNFFDGRAGR